MHKHKMEANPRIIAKILKQILWFNNILSNILFNYSGDRFYWHKFPFF